MGEDILLATTGTLHAVKIANSRRNNVSKRGVHLLQRCSAEQAVLRPAHLPQLQPQGKILVVPGLGLKDSGSSEGSHKNTAVGLGLIHT